ncbi:MAG: hypothetical protein KAY32_03605 [Candidatus Eisenbacteria sp.]|nr:hypothetical protein [Candidatus Eisenbacteria bacterium]
MHSNTLAAAEKCLIEGLEYIKDKGTEPSLPYMVWQRLGRGAWRGEMQSSEVPHIRTQRRDWIRLSKPLDDSLRNHHSDHFGRLGSTVLGHHFVKGARYLKALTLVTWHRIRAGATQEEAVAASLRELAAFIDDTHFTVRYAVPISNLVLDAAVVELEAFPGMSIREPSAGEATMIYGGTPPVSPSCPRPRGFHPFVVAGEFREPKLAGEQKGFFSDEFVNRPGIAGDLIS